MTHMMLEENAKLFAKVQQLESSNNNSSSETSAGGKSEELEKMKQQIEQKDKEIDDLRSRQKKFDSDISQLKGQLKEKASSETSAEGKSEELEKMKQQIEQKDKEIDNLKQLEKENESLSQENSNLGVQLETANDKIANLKTELSESESARIILKEEIERASKNESPDEIKLKTDLEQMQEKYKNLNLESEAEINKKNEKIQELEDKLKEIKDEVKAKTQALKDKEEEISDKESVIKQLQDTKSAENNNKDSGSSEASLKKELEAAKRTSLEKEIKEKDKDIIDLKKKLSASERKSFEKEIKKKDKEITELKKKLSASESTHARYESRQRNDGSKYEKELQNAHEEIEELKNRLSKMMGDQITENNPDIADLSDLNRPTKLAEKYSELYDNEWTDCYEEMENNSMNTNDILGELFEILKDIYLFSQKVSYDYEKNVKSSALTIPGIQRRPETSKLNSSTRKQLVDLRKTFAPQLASDFFKLYLQKCKENTDGRPKTKKFMNLCAEICWLMSVQDPPVVFEFEEPKGGFDKEKYKYYTKSGTQMDFIVWPPMKLHQTGPLLAKGVAQAK
ncbi:hypothetical protein ACF0H5_011116 [Mactra antiquata]